MSNKKRDGIFDLRVESPPEDLNKEADKKGGCGGYSGDISKVSTRL